MKNIHKLAEEIFQAPTQKDLTERYWQSQHDKVDVGDNISWSTEKQPADPILPSNRPNVKTGKVVEKADTYLVVRNARTRVLETVLWKELTWFLIIDIRKIL